MKRIHSKILNKDFTVDNGVVKFDDGVFYNPEDFKKLIGSSEEMIKAVHGFMLVFEGKII